MLDSLPVLSILIWMPIIGGLILLFLKSVSEKYIRVFGHSVSLVTLVLSLIILNEFDAEQLLNEHGCFLDQYVEQTNDNDFTILGLVDFLGY